MKWSRRGFFGAGAAFFAASAVAENWKAPEKSTGRGGFDDVAEVRKLQRFTTTSSYLLYGLGQGQIGFLKGVKAALAEMGLVKNVLAAPFKPFAGAELKPVRAALKRLRSIAM